MPRTHRFPRRLVRLTSLLVSFGLMLSILVVGPFGTTAKAPRNLKTAPGSLNSLTPQSTGGRERAPRDAGKRADPIPAERGAPAADLPNLDQLRRRKPEKPKAPSPIPSTKRAFRKETSNDKKAADVSATEGVASSKAANPDRERTLVGSPRLRATSSARSVHGPNHYRTLLTFLDSGRILSHHSGLNFLKFSTLHSETSRLNDLADQHSSDRLDLFVPPLPQSGSSKILFASNREGSMQIYVMNGDGSGMTRLTYSGANDDFPRWSPNGNKVLFQSDRDNPFSGIYDIYVMNADGSGITRLTTNSNDDSMASWSPDGSKIVFQSFRTGIAYQVYLMNADGAGQVNLTNTSSNDFEPSLSANGAKIAFASDRDHAGTSSVYVMNSNGTGQQRLTFSAASFDDRQPSWSRDGAKIAFVSTRDSVTETWTDTDDYEIPGDDGQTFPRSLLHVNKEVYVMNADGSGQTRLTNELANDESPSWSPDGTKIIFRSDRERDGSDPTAQIWTMNADGTGQLDLSNNVMGDYAASWNSGGFNQTPVANAGGSYSGGTGQNISFNGGGSSDPDGNIVSYSWNFGDGSNGSGATPTHAYSATGSFTVTLTVVDNLGAQATASTTANIAGPTVDEVAAARLDPFNQTGNQMMARDCEWGLPLVSLPGRSGMDLGIGLSYSSMVWTRAGSFMSFDDDRGDPSPGFRIGFPTIGPVFYDMQVGMNARLMITSSGRRVELRQVSAGIYQSADSSYLRLTDNGGSLLLRTTDGTQMEYYQSGGEWHCFTVTDRNGNKLTATYNAGDISTVTDTLGRLITFEYDGFLNLKSIKQTWTIDGATQTHEWATFGWQTKTFTPAFSVGIVGHYQDIPVLTQVGLPDGSRYNFDYTGNGQIEIIHRTTSDNVERSYTKYVYDTPTGDCPRITSARVWAKDWSGGQDPDVPLEVETAFHDLGSGWHEVIAPDGTTHKELYSTSGWQRGLTLVTEDWRYGGSVPEKSTSISWEEDDTCTGCQTNPRVKQTDIQDAPGNHRRTTINYDHLNYAQYGLPYLVTESDGNGNALRYTYTDYNLGEQYVGKNIIGLVSAVQVFDPAENKFISKTTYGYDASSIGSQATTATQHDSSFNSSSLVRGNVTSVSRWDTTDSTSINEESKALTTSMTYNAAGSLLSITDPSPAPHIHTINVSYTDAFPDDRNTFAYPTTITNADGYSSYANYNFDFGAVTQQQTPQPNTIQNTPGPVHTVAYDEIGRLRRITLASGAYQRFEYYPDGPVTWSTINNATDQAYTYQRLDGLGRTWMNISLHPGSQTNLRGQWTRYDVMGRVAKQSNPTEIDGEGRPAGDDSGWNFTAQTYDWKGRPLRTTHADGYYTEASYTGCGCAGGEVTSVTDEAGRQRRTTTDVLGRLVKTEEMNWEVNGTRTPYSTANYVYNALDQVKSITHEGQQRSFAYDGYGRLSQRTTPEQGTSTYLYNPDDTLQSVTDARQAITSYIYNNRHQIKNINYTVTGDVAGTPNVSFDYDAAGNRTSMTDGLGSASYGYDSLSRMTSETRTFSGVGSYALGYTYNFANELMSITGPSQFGSVWVGYQYDTNGRLRQINAANVPDNVGTLGYGMTYRAFGAVKSMTFGDHQSLSTSYDNRMRPTSWDVANVLGFSYTYYGGNSFGGSNQVNYARNLSSNGGRDSTLDRSYEYDQVGALLFAHSGAEARAAFGIDGTQWGTMDGPYSLGFDYDPQGNMTLRYGWGGEVQGGTAGQTSYKPYTYSNGKNQRDGFTYDAGGNLKIDNVAHYLYGYDATGQQTGAVNQISGYYLGQSYDGNGLRGKKIENETNVTYYLRSSVLGGAVLDELDGSGSFSRGYFYRGDQLLAVQQNNHMYWVHEDAVTKSQRTTDAYGNVTPNGVVELDPWGANTARSSASVFQPQTFTGYTRDANGDSDAGARRYSVTGRFPQPDPSGGSYDFNNPQSLNRYAYVGNDPVNFRDPSGAEPNEIFCGADYGWNLCGGSPGFWGGYFGRHVAEYNKEYGGLSSHIAEAMGLYQQRVSNAVGGLGFLTNAQVREIQIDAWVYNPETDKYELWASVVRPIEDDASDPFSYLMGARDSWPPEWPRPGDGFDRRFGWRTQPPPEMEPFPEKITIGEKGIEVRRVFDPNISPSNASRGSQIARGVVNSVGKFLTGFFSVAGATFTDFAGVLLGPSFVYDACRQNPYDYRCRKPGPQL